MELDNAMVQAHTLVDAAKEEPLSPFDYPDRVMERLTLKRFLDDLRQSVPPGLMPSAKGISTRQYCSKPEYLSFAIEKTIESEDTGAMGSYGSGYYANDTAYPWMNANTGVYIALHVGEFILLCHLPTDKCWVAVDGNKTRWVPWHDGLTLPANLFIYKDAFDCYV